MKTLLIVGTVALLSASSCQRVKPMNNTEPFRTVELLLSTDHHVCDDAAARILEGGEQYIDQLLELQGRGEVYAGVLGNPRGSMAILVPLSGSSPTLEQRERVVTVEVAALYLLSSIHMGRMDFASSALLVDVGVQPERRFASNTSERVARGYVSAKVWADKVRQEGLHVLQRRKEDPLQHAHLAFW